MSEMFIKDLWNVSHYKMTQMILLQSIYSVFHQLRQAKLAYGGSILSSCQFLILLSSL